MSAQVLIRLTDDSLKPLWHLIGHWSWGLSRINEKGGAWLCGSVEIELQGVV